MTAKKGLVIVGGDDTEHDLLGVGNVLQTAGLDAGILTWKGSGFQRFVNLKRLAEQADVFIFYSIDAMFTVEQQEAFAALLAQGRGLVMVHCSSVPHRRDGTVGLDNAPLHRLVGSSHGGHGPSGQSGRHAIAFHPSHPITRDLDEFSVWEEYYEIAFDDTTDLESTVVATRTRDDGTEVPVLYVREVDGARVAYLALGHDQRTWGQPEFMALASATISWAARDR